MRNAAGIFCVALLVRVAYIFLFVAPEHLGAEDQLLYLSMAQSIMTNGFTVTTTERVSGYPLFLSSVFFLFGQGQYGLLGVQAVIDSATCVCVGRLAHVALGRGFLFAGLLAAANLNMVILSAMVLTDSLFLCLFTLFLLFLIRFLHGRKSSDYAWCLSFLVLATAIRSASYYLVPCIMLALVFWSILARTTPKRIGFQFLAGVTIAVVILGPQHLHNWQKHDTLSYVSQGGTHLLGWVVPATYQYSGQGSYQQGQALAHSRLEKAMADDGLSVLPENPFAASRYRSEIARQILKDLGWVNMMKAWTIGAAVNFVTPSAAFAPAVRAMDHPSFYETPGVGVLEKLWNYANNSSGVLYLSILVVGTLTSLVFFLASLVGWWETLRGSVAVRSGWAGYGILIFFTLVIAYFVAVTGPIIGGKYRLPIEPIMTVFVVNAFYRYCRRIKSQGLLDTPERGMRL
ncbi:MAG: hypothetical protein A3H93_15150 [Rhodocyclales bacterium RIFCSPLOWO2_02_FULL_63_24]|nr:MAG: hypothetical protein A3H93_15150 [Rhodocyclales bacterium RIFCSPLOWO2_02_FULL_63_24]